MQSWPVAEDAPASTIFRPPLGGRATVGDGKMNELRFPHGEAPVAGTAIEVAPGLLWARLKLPIALDHINIYFIDTGTGWLAVDTGMRGGETRATWQQLLAEPLRGRPIEGVIGTHMHPDHIGQAGWLCESFDAPLYMTYGEYFTARTFTSLSEGVSSAAQRFIHRAGLDVEAWQRDTGKAGGAFMRLVEPLPTAFRRLEDGDVLSWGGRAWRVIVGRGHSPEHACLYCPELKVLISGDQVIAKITSNVSVSANEPEGNPLRHWLDSLKKLRREVPDDVLVLPAHNLPFYGLHQRLNQLYEHHTHHLDTLETVCQEPKAAVDLLPHMFRRTLTGMELAMGVGECIAHLHVLMEQGRVARSLDAEGVYRYQTLASDAGEQIYHVDPMMM